MRTKGNFLVRSAFKGSSCGVAARRPEPGQFKQVLPGIFKDAVSEQKLSSSKIDTNQIPF